MNTEKQTDRLIGGLFLITMVLSLWNSFGLTNPIFAEPGWVQHSAQMPSVFAVSGIQ